MKFFLHFFLFLGLTGCTTTFYVVRHAEKSLVPPSNPPLSAEGEQRAEHLSEVLRDKNIQAVYSTPLKRTIATAQPTADYFGLPVQIYEVTQQAAFIDSLKKTTKNSLVVGHSNTVRDIVNGLYESDTLHQDLDDTAYDNLYIIKRRKFPKKRLFINEKY